MEVVHPESGPFIKYDDGRYSICQNIYVRSDKPLIHFAFMPEIQTFVMGEEQTIPSEPVVKKVTFLRIGEPNVTGIALYQLKSLD